MTTGVGGTPPPDDGHGRRGWLPDPGSRLGALFYAVVGGLIVWLAVDVLPHHLHVAITWT